MFGINQKYMLLTYLLTYLGDYMLPETDRAWEKEQKNVVEEIRRDSRYLYVAVDGQYDSPRHSASYCTMTVMDVKSNNVIDV